MKQFHVINVGVSILSNFQRSNFSPTEIRSAKFSDNKIWNDFINNTTLMNTIYDFVEKSPREASAELNSFLRKIKNSNDLVEVYFTGTKTPANEICVKTLERFMKQRDFKVYITKEFPGYFVQTIKSEDRSKSFVKGISDMLDHLISLAEKKKREGYKVYFNPTGGFKAHVIASALSGFLTFSEVYYLNEEFDDIITFPMLFYLPKGDEISLLSLLQDQKPRSGKDYGDLMAKFHNEIERLEEFGLIEREQDESSKFFRVKITHRGMLYLKFREEE